jgi:hypothetical protein
MERYEGRILADELNVYSDLGLLAYYSSLNFRKSIQPQRHLLDGAKK